MEVSKIKEIPNFNWKKYSELNPYLYILGLRNKIEYENNYLNEGRYIGRIYDENQKKKKSINVLMSTIGKKSIFKTLLSLKNQLRKEDYLTIIFDGIDTNIDIVKFFCNKNLLCNVNIIYEENNLGYWGHGIRNKYKDLKGDFIYHCDDDDEFLPNAIDKIKKICLDLNTIYLFKIIRENGEIIWKNKEIKINKISTQSGVIPNHINKDGYWELKYGGDYDFYKKITDKYNVLYIDEIIYKKN